MSTTMQDSNTIAETVRRALNDAGYGSYYEYAGAVITALEARERAISDQLIDEAIANTDYDEDEARNLLRRIGLVVTEIEDEGLEEEGDESSTARILDAIATLGSRIDNLERLARQAGLR